MEANAFAVEQTQELVKALREDAQTSALSALLPPENADICLWFADTCLNWNANSTTEAAAIEHDKNKPGPATMIEGGGLLDSAMERLGSFVGCGADVDCIGSAFNYMGIGGRSSAGTNSQSSVLSSLTTPVWNAIAWLAGKKTK